MASYSISTDSTRPRRQKQVRAFRRSNMPWPRTTRTAGPCTCLSRPSFVLQSLFLFPTFSGQMPPSKPLTQMSHKLDGNCNVTVRMISQIIYISLQTLAAFELWLQDIRSGGSRLSDILLVFILRTTRVIWSKASFEASDRVGHLRLGLGVPLSPSNRQLSLHLIGLIG